MAAEIGSVDWQTNNFLSNFYLPHNTRLNNFLKQSGAEYFMDISTGWRQPNDYPEEYLQTSHKHCLEYKDNNQICYRIGKYFKNPCPVL